MKTVDNVATKQAIQLHKQVQYFDGEDHTADDYDDADDDNDPNVEYEQRIL